MGMTRGQINKWVKEHFEELESNINREYNSTKKELLNKDIQDVLKRYPITISIEGDIAGARAALREAGVYNVSTLTHLEFAKEAQENGFIETLVARGDAARMRPSSAEIVLSKRKKDDIEKLQGLSLSIRANIATMSLKSIPEYLLSLGLPFKDETTVPKYEVLAPIDVDFINKIEKVGKE